MDKVSFAKERLDIIERIRMIMGVKNMSGAQLANALGYSRSHPVTNILNGNCELRFIFLQRLLLFLPTLNLNWLYKGEGEMFTVEE